MPVTIHGLAGCTFSWEGACNNGSGAAVNGGPVTTLMDVSGNGNHATGGSGATLNNPSINGDGVHGEVLFFGSGGFGLPSGVTVGNGSPANEGTIIWAQAPIPGGAGLYNGFPWSIGGGHGPWANGSSGQTIGGVSGVAAYAIYNGSENYFPYGEDLGQTPIVMAVQYNSSQTKLWIGTDCIQVIGSNLIGTQSGGFVGELTSGSFQYSGTLATLEIYNQCAADAALIAEITRLQDLLYPGRDNSIALYVFGDSRTRGHNSQENDISFNRAWPFRCVKIVGGGYRLASNSAASGNTIAQQKSAALQRLQYAAFNGTISTYSKRVATGELGINDIIGNASATTVTASLVDFVSTLISGGINTVALGTITAVSSLSTPQQAVLTAVNAAIRTPSTFGANAASVVVVDNAADARLSQSNAAYADPGGDGLHWSDAGYGVYAENFAKALRLVAFPVVASGGASLSVSNGVIYSRGSISTSNGVAVAA